MHDAKPLVEVNGLTKNYGAHPALKMANFKILPGEIIALLGPNGAGKTTIMKMLTGFLEPSAGSIFIDGLNLADHRIEVQRRIGYLPENAPIYTEMLVQDYLFFSARMRGVGEAEIFDRVKESVVSTGIADVLIRPISELSKGYRQRVGLAQAILHKPKLLILDEPTNGLDPTQIAEMRGLIRRLAQSSTILLSTHILSEAEATCDRAIIIYRGEIKVDAPISTLSKNQEVLATIYCDETTSLNPQSIAQKLGPQDIFELLNVEHVMEGDQTFFTLRLRGKRQNLTDRKLAFEAAQVLQAQGWNLCELKPHAQNLETVFKELTQS